MLERKIEEVEFFYYDIYRLNLGFGRREFCLVVFVWYLIMKFYNK